ncbi:hypothetical protein TrVFT333_009409 [Trichoderma virens FT-333]|nr:hypothetical protein TrVFT333_009409 [Trichoderma virens FT-333]
MAPSEDAIAKFISCVPDADEGKAWVFLEGAASIDEAVEEYLDNPGKYSQPEPKSLKPADAVPGSVSEAPPAYHTPSYKFSNNGRGYTIHQHIQPHTNKVIEAAGIRARDEVCVCFPQPPTELQSHESQQEMQNVLQNVQLAHRIFNSDIEPEHDADTFCGCDIHQYIGLKARRLDVQNMWSEAVMYPGEKSYHDCYQTRLGYFSKNPYRMRVTSPYGNFNSSYMGVARPIARYYSLSVHQTISLNAQLNGEAQSAINAREPMMNIWDLETPDISRSISEKKGEQSSTSATINGNGEASSSIKPSRFITLMKVLSIKSPEEKAAIKLEKAITQCRQLRDEIVQEENGRWPDTEWRQIVATYQNKVGMANTIAQMRQSSPIQYFHMLRAGYFEPIPVAWANQISNPLKFTIDASAGWRGITPAWRGYDDTAEERLYWVLNHRAGAGGRLKPDMISALDMARRRMASAVEPPPAYFAADDTCHLQHTSEGYSKQVMPPPFRPYDVPETASDDSVILLDVSGSMDFEPMRPLYDEYLITGYTRSTQPKNRDTAKAIIRRFTDALANHDHNFQGYQLTTFANHADYIGILNHRNFEKVWGMVRFGGGTRVMTGWQKVKELHFQKHSASATYHPVYGWQAGPETPILRVLLLLDGEAQDMDEFELDLLGLSWVHVTIFLVGVDGCPHHHRHANELQRISEVNPHVSFVDAQGNTPERFVTHELLKRHLGYEMSMQEFEEIEHPPAYIA